MVHRQYAVCKKAARALVVFCCKTWRGQWAGQSIRRSIRLYVNQTSLVDVAGGVPAGLSAVTNPAQRAQMQARPLSSAGTRSIKARLNVAWRHQQGVSSEPLVEGAQAFGPPHKGH